MTADDIAKLRSYIARLADAEKNGDTFAVDAYSWKLAASLPAALDALEQARDERDGAKAAVDVLDAEANQQMERNIELRRERDEAKQAAWACEGERNALKDELERLKVKLLAERELAEQFVKANAENARQETAEQIAAWLDARHTDYLSARGTDRQTHETLLAAIRSGAWKDGAK